MKLKEYLDTLETGIQSGNFSKKLGVRSCNQSVYVGGSFDDLVETMLSGESWKPGKHERLRQLLEKRKRAHKDWEDAIPEPDPSFLRTSKEEIHIPNDNIYFKHDYPIEALITAINDVNSQQMDSPYDKLKSQIIMNGAHVSGMKKSAQGVLYFGKYALNRKVPFVVGWLNLRRAVPRLEFF